MRAEQQQACVVWVAEMIRLIAVSPSPGNTRPAGRSSQCWFSPRQPASDSDCLIYGYCGYCQTGYQCNLWTRTKTRIIFNFQHRLLVSWIYSASSQLLALLYWFEREIISSCWSHGVCFLLSLPGFVAGVGTVTERQKENLDLVIWSMNEDL